MKKKLTRLFIFSAGAILMATALAKFVSSSGSAPILEAQDPVLPIPIRYLFALVGAVETGVVGACFLSKRRWIPTALVAWLSTGFVLYRLGLVWVGYHGHCPCLGNVTDALHLSPFVVDWTMRFIVLYLLAGSYTTLCWHLQRMRKARLLQHKRVPTPFGV